MKCFSFTTASCLRVALITSSAFRVARDSTLPMLLPGHVTAARRPGYKELAPFFSLFSNTTEEIQLDVSRVRWLETHGSISITVTFSSQIRRYDVSCCTL